MIAKRMTIVIVFMMLISASSMNVLADQFGSVCVDMNNDYIDSEPAVWNKYIVWARGVDNIVVDGQISRDEPSWIMIHDITTDETWNITPTIDAGMTRSGAYYYHADKPNIYGDKVVYREAYLTGVTGYVLGMYNITDNETFEPYFFPVSWSNTYTVAIYGNWIMKVHIGSGGTTVGTGMIYNYKTEEVYQPNLERPSNIQGAEFSIYNNYVAWSDYVTSPSTLYTVFVFNLDNLKCIRINCADKPVSATRFCDIYEDTLLFKVLDGTYSNWDLYAFNLNSINWTGNVYGAKPVTGNFNLPTTYSWSEIEGNVTEVCVGDNVDVQKGKLWINDVYYQTDQETGKIYKHHLVRNQTTAIVDIPFNVRFNDVQYDKVVWADDRTGEFNIYRLTTTSESFGQIFLYALPVLFIGIIVVFFWKSFSSGLEGMI